MVNFSKGKDATDFKCRYKKEVNASEFYHCMKLKRKDKRKLKQQFVHKQIEDKVVAKKSPVQEVAIKRLSTHKRRSSTVTKNQKHQVFMKNLNKRDCQKL